MVVRIQNGLVLLRDEKVTTSSECCCGQCPTGETQCGEECCTQDETCCSGECCTYEQTCCSGECCDNVCCNGECCEAGFICCNGICCPPENNCINGECVPICPDERRCGESCCEPEETCCNGECCDLLNCDFEDNRFEIISAPYDTSPCGVGFVPQSIQQVVYQSGDFWVPPAGVNWKSPIPGLGPGATLNGCRYVIVVNEAYSGCHVNFEDFDYCLGVGDYRTEIKVLRVDCDGNVDDVTDDVLEGDVYKDRYFGGIAGTACTTPGSPPFLDFYPDPEFICPP